MENVIKPVFCLVTCRYVSGVDALDSLDSFIKLYELDSDKVKKKLWQDVEGYWSASAVVVA